MQVIAVKYENGIFIPIEPIQGLAEGGLGKVYISEAFETAEAIKSSQFFGLWKDREEIEDGMSYVRNLRAKQRYER